ncbi:hypothetical protein GGE07_005452 [Sinorhizobium terangae]|nr:hypothetical protein [Sinorhizobium terangae]
MKRAQTIEINELEAGALNAFPAIEPLLRPSRTPLSHFRHRLMFVSYEGDGSELCNEMPLCEKLAAVAPRLAVDWFVARKEVPHASGTVDGEPFQQIGWEADGPPLMRGDLAAAGVETLATLIHQEGQVACDLPGRSTDPQARTQRTLRRTGADWIVSLPRSISVTPFARAVGQNELERVEGSEASSAPSQLCWALIIVPRRAGEVRCKSFSDIDRLTPEGANPLRAWLIGAAGQRPHEPHPSNNHKLMNWQRDNHPRSSSCG